MWKIRKIFGYIIVLSILETTRSDASIFPDFKVTVVGSFAFTIDWEPVANLSYVVVAKIWPQKISDCEEGFSAVKSPFLLNQTINGSSLQPETNYNLALCAVDKNGTISPPRVIRERTAYRLSCYSLESKCAFPFELEGVKHSQCWTTSRVTPWCATTSDYENAHQWINCTYCQTPGCTTTPKCFFPFTYLGKTYTSCTPIDNQQYNNQPWCALQPELPDASLINTTWKNCENCAYSGCAQKTVKCSFPFIYQGQSYSSCIVTDISNGAWCSITPNFDEDKQWRNCSLFCLEPPKLKATPISMTSLQFDWPPLYWTLNGIIISSGPFNTFPKITPPKISTTATAFDLRPYTFYDVSVIGIGTYPNGTEFRTSALTQTVLMFSLSFCPESTIIHPTLKIPVTFPRTQAGYKNGSREICSNTTPNSGCPMGVRVCGIDANWEEPDWLNSCNETVQSLERMKITTETDRHNIATQLSILTFNATKLSSHDIHQTSTVLQTVTSTDTISQSTSSQVASCIGNLLKSSTHEFTASGASRNLLATLDSLTTKVAFESKKKLHFTESELSIAVFKINKSETEKHGLIYKENYNPSSLGKGFSKEQFVVNSLSTKLPKNDLTSSISIPHSVLTKSKDGRMRFYAFARTTLFPVSLTATYFDINAISPNSTVQSNSVLAASVGEKVKNLDETVKMKFQYTQATCPSGKDSSQELCGEYLCGFWNESGSVWSTDGCSLVTMTQHYIECECDHLTNFATLFAYGNSTRIREDNILDYLTIICCSISFVAAVLIILCLLVLRRWKDAGISNRTTIVMINLSMALIILEGMLLISSTKRYAGRSCIAIAVLLHFGLLSTLMWCLVEASYVCLAIVKPIYYQTGISSKKLLLISMPLGWGFPAFFVLINVIANISAYESVFKQSNVCWIVPEMIVYIVIIPCSVILSAILVIYVITIRGFLTKKQVGESANKKMKNKNGKSLILSLILFFMFGVTWIIGFTLFNSSSFNMTAAYIFTVTNSLQGLILFLLFVVRNEKIRHAMRKRIESLTSSEKTRSSSLGGGRSS